jgi:hypothetical protein
MSNFKKVDIPKENNKTYDKLRVSYRNLIQIITTQVPNEFASNEVKKNWENVYRMKNVKKSIDNDLKDYCQSVEYTFANIYWKDYAFTEETIKFLNENQKIQTFNQDFINKMSLYFNVLNNEENNFVPPNLEDIKKYLSPDFFTNLQENIERIKKTTEENTSDTENKSNLENIEFPEFIVDLAKELSNEIEIPPELENINEPSELIQKIMQEDGQKMVMNLMNKVSTKLQKKIDSGQINQNQMKEQAQECLNNLMKQNPAMKEMVDQMINGMKGPGVSEYKRNQSKANTRERLRQKLEKKKQEAELNQQQEQVNVENVSKSQKKKKKTSKKQIDENN